MNIEHKIAIAIPIIVTLITVFVAAVSSAFNIWLTKRLERPKETPQTKNPAAQSDLEAKEKMERRMLSLASLMTGLLSCAVVVSNFVSTGPVTRFTILVISFNLSGLVFLVLTRNTNRVLDLMLLLKRVQEKEVEILNNRIGLLEQHTGIAQLNSPPDSEKPPTTA